MSQNLLVPRNTENREEKLRQRNLKMLQQKVIYGNLHTDESWNFSENEVETRKIVGNLIISSKSNRCSTSNYPELFPWLKNLECDGDVFCSCIAITSLKNAPFKILGNFWCHHNIYLNSLQGMPKYIGGNFLCYKNNITFKEENIPKDTVIKGISIFVSSHLYHNES